MTTEADEHLEKARVSIKNSIRHLSRIVCEECWGHDEYTGDMRTRMKDTLLKLLEAKDILR